MSDNIPSETEPSPAKGESGRPSPFEAIRRLDNEGREYWSARDIANLLEYSQWQKFKPVLSKAQEACTNSGRDITDHFTRTDELIVVGKGAQRRVESYRLSRYACYLIIENADPSKPIVAQGQTYFAVQTRRAEIAELREAQAKRLELRTHASETNKKLAEAAQDAGVPSGRFGIFQDSGYKGLYDGLGVAEIKEKKAIPTKDDILDRMGREELGANIFRITQAEAALREADIQDEERANAIHREAGEDVRGLLRKRGRRMPEDLPPEPTIKPLLDEQRRKSKRKEIGQKPDQPSLFDRPDGNKPNRDD